MFIESFILAAGSSKRAGKINKLTKKFIGKPLIEHTLNNYCNAKINRNNVITGYERDKIEKITNKFNIFSIYNKDFKKGLLTSIKVAIENIHENTTGVLIGLADMPLVKKSDLNKIINRFESCKEKKICIPICYKKYGNPIIFPVKKIELLNTRITGKVYDAGLKSLIKKEDFVTVNTSKGILKQFDKISDFY